LFSSCYNVLPPPASALRRKPPHYCAIALAGGDQLGSAPMKAPHEMHPGNRYARERGAGRTLGELVAAKIALVAVCRRCKHRRVLYPARLIARYGEHCPAIELRGRLRCTACRYGSANLHESSR
jgi:hypothetical protein